MIAFSNNPNGYFNLIEADLSIAIGENSSVNGSGSLSSGSSLSVFSDNSFLGGSDAVIHHDNSFIWNDGSSHVESSLENSFTVYAEGGFGINRAVSNPSNAVEIEGRVIIFDNLIVTGTIGASNFGGSSYGANTGDQTITLTGDVSGSGQGSFETTLKQVNPDVGTYGGTSQIPSITVNNKGLITSVGVNVILAGAGNLTGDTLKSSVVNSSLTSVGTLSSLTVSGDLTVDNNVLKVDSNNNRVGIREGSPKQMLHITNGNTWVGVRLEANPANSSFIELYDTSDTGGRIVYKHTDDYFTFSSQGSEKLRIDSAGNVGIAQAIPTEKLHVGGNILASGTINGSNLSGTNTGDVKPFCATGSGTDIGVGVFLFAVMDISTTQVSNSNYTLNSNTITVSDSGTYQISYSIQILDDTSTGDVRGRTSGAVSLNGATVIEQSLASAYTREESGGTGLSNSFIIDLSSSDVLTLLCKQDGVGVLDISLERSQISIIKLV